MIVGCFTPLVKIFLPYFWVPVMDKDGKPVFERDAAGKVVLDRFGKPMPKEERITCNDLLKDAERIIRVEPMRFLVPRSVGAFSVALNRPTNCSDPNLVMYLTGDDIGQQIDPTWQVHTETDCYGMASIPLRPDVQGALISSLASVDLADTETILKDERETARRGHERAVAISEHRAVRAARHVVKHLKLQRQLDKEANRGHYVPSPSEYLAAYYLAETEKDEAAQMQQVVSQFGDMMDKIEQKGNLILR